MTSASSIHLLPLRVKSSGSPGPAPTRNTLPVASNFLVAQLIFACVPRFLFVNPITQMAIREYLCRLLRQHFSRCLLPSHYRSEINHGRDRLGIGDNRCSPMSEIEGEPSEDKAAKN